jgi:hypothetical protein
VPEPISATIGASVIGAGAGLYGSSQAARAQKSAADRAARTQTEMFNRQVELQEPFREAGLTAQNRLMTLLGLEGGEAGAADFGRYSRDFGMADFEADPGYGFRMSEGMKALERSSAARGGLLSGTTLKGIQRFGQDLASNEYQNAFNRYYAARNAQLNPLQGMLGQGQSSTNVLTGAAGEAGRGIGAAQMAGGAARASGYAAGTNALTGALQSGMQGYLQYNAMRPGGYGAYAPQAGTYYGPTAYGSGVTQFDV